MLIEYISDIWLCCGSMVARAQPFGPLQVACFNKLNCSTKRGGSSSAAAIISGIFVVSNPCKRGALGIARWVGAEIGDLGVAKR